MCTQKRASIAESYPKRRSYPRNLVKLEFCFSETTPVPSLLLLLFLLLLLSETGRFPTFATLAAFVGPPSATEPNKPTPAVDRFEENDVLPNVELPVATGAIPFPVPNTGAEGTPIPPNEGIGELETLGATPKLVIPKPGFGDPPKLLIPKLERGDPVLVPPNVELLVENDVVPVSIPVPKTGAEGTLPPVLFALPNAEVVAAIDGLLMLAD